MKLILVFILAFLLAVGICACEPVDHCRIDSTRCLGPVAQVGDANERWVEIMNCDDVSAQSGSAWSGQPLPGGSDSTCLPIQPADGGAQ